MIVAPSLLAADFLNLHDEIDMINRSQAEWLHLDVMDGIFVPNISFGFPVLKAVSRECHKFKDAHFMILHPEEYIESAAKCGCQNMTFHYETCVDNWHCVVDAIHASGMKAGISIKPGTPVSVYDDMLPFIDLALIMSVEPGFGGQKFRMNSVDKIAYLRRTIDSNHYKCLIEVDGGINQETAQYVKHAGVDVLVAGSYVFNAENPNQAIQSLF